MIYLNAILFAKCHVKRKRPRANTISASKKNISASEIKKNDSITLRIKTSHGQRYAKDTMNQQFPRNKRIMTNNGVVLD